MQYVDNTLDYVLIARNTGTTASLNTVVEATLPLGIQYVSSTQGGKFDSATNRVSWSIGTLPTGGEFVCMLTCEAKREGDLRLDAKVTESTGLMQMANAGTFVDSIADIILEIEKPQDPIEVGSTAEYVVTIHNRGSKAAENIDVGIYFADAIEPISADGKRAGTDAKPRDVVFDRISVLPANEKRTYRVNARGLDSGKHKVHAELVCQSTETQLKTQVMSHFYKSSNTRASSSLANTTPSSRGNATAYPPAAVAQRNPSFDDSSTAVPAFNPSAMSPGVPNMTIPGPTSQSLQAPVAPVNPLASPGATANSGLTSTQMQQGATSSGMSSVPMMQIPDSVNVGQLPAAAPSPNLGTPGRLQQRTGGIAPLPPPPVIPN
jgi:uncharacterized repeat protein (TIGR01451 family)